MIDFPEHPDHPSSVPDPEKEGEESHQPLNELVGHQRAEIESSLERPPFGEVMEDISQKADALRLHLRNEASEIMRTSTGISEEFDFTGSAFIQDMGVVREFENGITEFFYDEHGARMRGANLAQRAPERIGFFEDIAVTFPPQSRILSIGSALDSAPLRAYLRGGHEVVATDAGKNLMEELSEQAGVPTFACDLIHLNEIVPPDTFDIVTGNSTLAYLDPRKTSRIIAQLVEVMRIGGVFTFDLSPHPNHFRIAEEKDRCTVINEAEPDPQKIIELIEQYGVEEGIAAAAYYYYIRHQAVQLGTLVWLQGHFEQHGLRTQVGVKNLECGGTMPVHTLRVFRSGELMQPAEDEEVLEVNAAYWDAFDVDQPFLHATAIDRASGVRLAELLGIEATEKQAPWRVATYLAQNNDSDALTPNTRAKIKSFFEPLAVRDRLQRVADGGPFTIGLKMPVAVAFDQGVHKQVLTGAMFGHLPEEMALELADASIDNKYGNATATPTSPSSPKKPSASRKKQKVKKKPKKKPKKH